MGKFKGVVTKRATAEMLLLRQASAGIGLCVLFVARHMAKSCDMAVG